MVNTRCGHLPHSYYCELRTLHKHDKADDYIEGGVFPRSLHAYSGRDTNLSVWWAWWEFTSQHAKTKIIIKVQMYSFGYIYYINSVTANFKLYRPISPRIIICFHCARSSMKHALYQDFAHTCWFVLRKCISNHETKQASKFQCDPSSNCFTIDFWKINCWIQHLISYFLIVFFCISFYTSSVVFWHVIFWG